jgi:hypothetical protein
MSSLQAKKKIFVTYSGFLEEKFVLFVVLSMSHLQAKKKIFSRRLAGSQARRLGTYVDNLIRLRSDARKFSSNRLCSTNEQHQKSILGTHS